MDLFNDSAITQQLINKWDLVEYQVIGGSGSLNTTSTHRFEISVASSNFVALNEAFLLVRASVKKGDNANLVDTDQAIPLNPAGLFQSVDLMNGSDRFSSTRLPGLTKTMIEPVFTGYDTIKKNQEDQSSYYLDVPYNNILEKYRDSQVPTDDNEVAIFTEDFSMKWDPSDDNVYKDTAPRASKKWATPESYDLATKALKHKAGSFIFKIMLRDILGAAGSPKPFRNLNLALEVQPDVNAYKSVWLAGKTPLTSWSLKDMRLFVPRVEFVNETDLVVAMSKQPVPYRFFEYLTERHTRPAGIDHEWTVAQKDISSLPRYVFIALSPIPTDDATITKFNKNTFPVLDSIAVRKMFLTIGAEQVPARDITPFGKAEDGTGFDFHRAYAEYLRVGPSVDRNASPMPYEIWRDRCAIFCFNLTEHNHMLDGARAIDVKLNYSIAASTAHYLNICQVNEKSLEVQAQGGSSVIAKLRS